MSCVCLPIESGLQVDECPNIRSEGVILLNGSQISPGIIGILFVRPKIFFVGLNFRNSKNKNIPLTTIKKRPKIRFSF